MHALFDDRGSATRRKHEFGPREDGLQLGLHVPVLCTGNGVSFDRMILEWSQMGRIPIDFLESQ